MIDPSVPAEPLTPPEPKDDLSNYLIVYAYKTGQVELHCTTPDPALNLKMLAIAADGMSNALMKLFNEAQSKSLIHRVNHG